MTASIPSKDPSHTPRYRPPLPPHHHFTPPSRSPPSSIIPCSWQSLWTLSFALSIFLYSLALRWTSTCSIPSILAVSARSRMAHALNMASSSRDDQQQLLPQQEKRPQWQQQQQGLEIHWEGDLRELESAWNRLCFGPPPEKLRIALFVKKWPVGGTPGGLERHALTLHKALAYRGHIIHVYTVSGDGRVPNDVTEGGLTVHFFKPTPGGGFDHNRAWEAFVKDNFSQTFDIVHSESVALPHSKADGISNLVVSWHGIAYEVIHANIVQDLIRKPDETGSIDIQKAYSERLLRVAEEVRFFRSYRHHVAISDYVGDVLRTIYELPLENVHIILNGVDEAKFRPDPIKGAAFRARCGVPKNASLVLGAAGRLVRDKGHPLLFEAFSQIVQEHEDVYLLVAGTGPWADRYKELAPNVLMLGSMPPSQLGEFYNAIDIFVDPTLRSQGLDLTLLEAMQCGKPLLATHFSSITWTVITHKDFGYTFSPNVPSLVKALKTVIKDGRDTLQRRSGACLEYASLLFTATKMSNAYERLFLCMKNQTYCFYPLSTDCSLERSKYV